MFLFSVHLYGPREFGTINVRKVWRKKAGQNWRKSKDGCRFSVKYTRYEMRLNVSLDMMFARLLFQDGAGNCKKAYWSIQEQSSHLQESSFFSCMDEVSVQHPSWKNNARANDHGVGTEEFESAVWFMFSSQHSKCNTSKCKESNLAFERNQSPI